MKSKGNGNKPRERLKIKSEKLPATEIWKPKARFKMQRAKPKKLGAKPNAKSATRLMLSATRLATPPNE